MTINKVLHDIQRNLKAPKNQYNSFAKYKYRSAEDILEAVKPLLPEGVALIGSDSLENIGQHNYVKATFVLTNGTDSIEASAYAREPVTKKGMDDSQITGATSSYARKYALNGLFCIDDTKDADSGVNHTDKKPAKPEPKEEKKEILSDFYFQDLLKAIQEAPTVEALKAAIGNVNQAIKEKTYKPEQKTDLEAAKDKRKAELEQKAAA